VLIPELSLKKHALTPFRQQGADVRNNIFTQEMAQGIITVDKNNCN
jgi:hypothetical protein